MNCLECQELLQKRLDGVPITAEVLEQHLDQCATCREQHAAAARLLEGMQQLPKPKLPANFAQDLAARIVRDRQQRRDRMRRRIYVTMALAASVLLMLFAAYWWMPRTERHGPKGPFVEDQKEPEIPV